MWFSPLYFPSPLFLLLEYKVVRYLVFVYIYIYLYLELNKPVFVSFVFLLFCFINIKYPHFYIGVSGGILSIQVKEKKEKESREGKTTFYTFLTPRCPATDFLHFSKKLKIYPRLIRQTTVKR